ncbi:MAG: single-stranded-DNA-specific exonuclease RecJ [Bradymonadia bacterium]
MAYVPGSRSWNFPEVDQHAVDQLARAARVPPLVASIMLRRGVDDPDIVRDFIDADLRHIPDPRGLDDIERACHRIIKALHQGEQITVYGDYDVDGVTSSSLLWLFFKEALDRELDVYIPHRLTEGYGLNIGAIDRLAARGTRVLITVDNGSSAVDEVAHARRLGIDVIIIDHHQVSDPEPEAFAHLNPHRPGCDFDGKQLAAVGVTFMLIIELRRQMRTAGFFTGRPEPRPDLLLDMVALGTVADVVPLTGVNRPLVRYGLDILRKRTRTGVQALISRAKLTADAVNSTDVAFRLGPRINAAGRIDDASWGFKLLTGDSLQEANRLAAIVEKHNEERQLIEKGIADQAVARVEGDPQLSDAPAVVLSDPMWHPGVIGIVASRLVERFRRPAILLGHDGDTLKGSARSVPGLDIKGALDRCSEHLLRHGGHAAAAGLALKVSALPAFVEAFNREVAAGLQGQPQQTGVEVDAVIDLHDLKTADIKALEMLEPYGQSNPTPVLAARGVQIQDYTVLRNNHLKMQVYTADGLCDAMAWRMAEQVLPLIQAPVDLLFAAGFNVWRGRKRLTLTVKDIRPAAG